MMLATTAFVLQDYFLQWRTPFKLWLCCAEC